MKIHEYIAKEIFHGSGIPTPHNIVAKTPTEVRNAAIEIDKPVAIKSQVLSGGRGKAGGIKFANNAEEACTIAEKLLGSTLKGEKVETVLVEEKL